MIITFKILTRRQQKWGGGMEWKCNKLDWLLTKDEKVNWDSQQTSEEFWLSQRTGCRQFFLFSGWGCATFGNLIHF